jgi:hypothetical protein
MMGSSVTGWRQLAGVPAVALGSHIWRTMTGKETVGTVSRRNKYARAGSRRYVAFFHVSVPLEPRSVRRNQLPESEPSGLIVMIEMAFRLLREYHTTKTSLTT